MKRVWLGLIVLGALEGCTVTQAEKVASGGSSPTPSEEPDGTAVLGPGARSAGPSDGVRSGKVGAALPAGSEPPPAEPPPAEPPPAEPPPAEPPPAEPPPAEPPPAEPPPAEPPPAEPPPAPLHCAYTMTKYAATGPNQNVCDFNTIVEQTTTPDVTTTIRYRAVGSKLCLESAAVSMVTVQTPSCLWGIAGGNSVVGTLTVSGANATAQIDASRGYGGAQSCRTVRAVCSGTGPILGLP